MFTTLGRIIHPWMVVLAICLVYLSVILAREGGDPLAFATLGTRFQDGDSAGSEGYDGQFAYYIALDPAGAQGRLDAPSYRYQRILYPMLARGLALGAPALIPWTLVAINVGAVVIGTHLMAVLLVGFQVSRWYALAFGLHAGVLMSARLDVAEPLSHGLIIGAALLFERGRPNWSAALLALSALAKETALLFAAGYVLFIVVTKGWRPALCFGLKAAGPLAIWQLVLWRWLGSPGVGSGGAMATPFEVVPLMGLWRIGQASAWGLGLYLIILGPLVVLPALWALWATGRDAVRRRWHPLSLALLLNAAALFFLPHSSWREFLAMLRLSVGLVIGVLLYAGLRRNRRGLNYSLGWLATLAFLFKEGTW